MRTYCVPVLARYAALGFAHSRGHLDAVLGATLVGAKVHFDEQDRVNGQAVRQISRRYQATNGFLTAGIGARYALGRHLESVVDWTYNRNVRFASSMTNRYTTGNRYGLTPAVSVGLRYRFTGHPKPAAF
ncbi:hypothetical protein ACFQT0_31485 [Hymenobacter humi]|uniref:Outer membrane protein beta-barrel domain-containing protein n=1 Tax=Hymenobacter humi TaxID=1411620 RepID=A0ABW2UGV5_9BACT